MNVVKIKGFISILIWRYIRELVEISLEYVSEISLNADESYLETGGNCYSIQELLRVNTIQKFSEVGSSLVQDCHVEAKRFLNLV